MTRTLFIHAGTPKTGSSFLQVVFNKSSKQLESCGVLYPGVQNGIHQARSNVDINGQLLTQLLIYKNKEQLSEVKVKVKLTELINSLFSLGKDKVFLSDETLGVVNSNIWSVINDVCLSLNIKLVVFSYYRKPEKYYPSHWAQLVRNHGEVLPLTEFADTTNLNVWRNILVITKQVGCAYAFSYEAELNREQGLLASAAKVLGIDASIFSNDGQFEVNPSLSLGALTAIRLINDEFGMEIGKKFNHQLTELQALRIKAKPRLPSKNESLLKDRHKEEIKQCESLYAHALRKLNL